MKAIVVLNKMPDRCCDCPMHSYGSFDNEHCDLMEYNSTPYNLAPSEDIFNERRRICPLLGFEPQETVELLEEMKANCLKPTSTDPKRFVKAEALAYAIEILKEADKTCSETPNRLD